MNFYYDYSTMVGEKSSLTGIPRTVYSLARAFKNNYPETRLVIIDDKLKKFHHINLIDDSIVIGDPVHFVKADVLFSAGGNWKFSCYNNQISNLNKIGVNFYQLFYDVIPALFPYMYKSGLGFGRYFDCWTKETLALTKHAFSISKCTKNDIIKLFSLDAKYSSKITVIRLGEDFYPSKNSYKSNKKSKLLKNELGSFILCVGTIELRKNHQVLLNAYRELAKLKLEFIPKLVIVGKSGWLNNNIKYQIKNDKDLSSLIFIYPNLSDCDLDYLYKNCIYTVYPSVYEGWGLPITESLSYLKPCIASNSSAMIEIAPNLVWHADPQNPREWASKIKELILEPVLIIQQSLIIKENYKKTSWDQTALSIFNTIFSEEKHL